MTEAKNKLDVNGRIVPMSEADLAAMPAEPLPAPAIGENLPTTPAPPAAPKAAGA